MRPALKAAVATTLVVGALVLGAMLLVSPSDATTGKDCKDLAVGPGWSAPVKVTGSPATVTVTADPGMLIDSYCVKAGGGSTAAVIVTVSPPAASVVVDHPTKPTVRQYAIHQVSISSGSGGTSGAPGSGLPSGTVSGSAAPPTG